MEIAITSYQDADSSKCDLDAVLKELRLETARIRFAYLQTLI